MLFDHEDPCVYFPEEIFESPVEKTLNIQTHQSGFCAGCKRGYHAGEQVALDPELRIVHWSCRVKEIQLGGHLEHFEWRNAR